MQSLFSFKQLNLISLLYSIRLYLIATICVSVLAAVSSISLLGLSAWLIASAALQPPLYVLSLAIVGVRCFGIMRAVFRYLERYLLHKTGFKLFGYFRAFILKQVTKSLPFSFDFNNYKNHDSKNPNVFNIIVNAVDCLRDNFLRFFLPPITATLITLLASFWLANYSFLLVIILLSSWLLFTIILPIIFLKLYKKQQNYSFSLTQDIMDFYKGNIEIQVYNYQYDKLSHCKNSIENYQIYNKQLFYLKNKITACSEIFTGCFLVLLFTLVIHLVNSKTFNAVNAITILLTFQAFLENLNQIPSLTQQIYEAQKNLDLLKPFLKSDNQLSSSKKTVLNLPKSPLTNSLKSISPILSVKNLSFGYDKILIKNINFNLYKGERTLLIGESGCGKSTLFYILTKLLNPISGEIFLNGKNIRNMIQEDIQKYICVSFQNHHLFHMSIRDNFHMIYPGLSDDNIITALKKVGLQNLYESYGLDYIIKSNGLNLSGGQKHRLQLAICLAVEKPIIFLDEPTAGLDVKTAELFLQQITQSYKNQAILISSHDLNIFHLFDNIIIMKNHTVIEQGNISLLLKNKNSYLFKLINYHNLI